MKVEELIHKLETMNPDWDLRVLVAQDGNLTVYGTDVVENVVTREIEGEDDEQNILTSDVYTYWKEK